jgi:hypothetical protein
LLVNGPSSSLRVAIRTDPRVDAATVVARATEFFAADPTGFLVIVRRPDDEDIERVALTAGFRAGWSERPIALGSPPTPGVAPDEIELRVVEDASAVVDYGRVVALATTIRVSASARRCCSTTKRSSRLTSERSSPTSVASLSLAR